MAKSPTSPLHVFLIDGSSYIFRAYHALPPLTRKSDGLQLNAVYGFCTMLWKLLRDMAPEDRPTHLAVVFDRSEITFRNDIFPDYKANRTEAPGDLIPQFPLVREAVKAFELPCLEQQGFEADDLIATYAREATERGGRVTIVSSDKDLMQLVTERVSLYDTMKDKRIGIAEVIEKFGVPPEKVIDVQALAGDSVDNVPGVPGIGIKTAAQLLADYGDLETLLARAGEIKQPKRRESLINFAEQARLSKRLVTLDDHVALDVPLDELAVHEPDAKTLIAFLKAMEFSSLTRRVADYAEIDPGRIAPDARLTAGGGGVSAHAANDATPEAKDKATTGPAVPARHDMPADALTPQAYARRAVDDARNAAPFDRSKSAAIRTLAELDHALTRAREAGRCGLAVERSDPDPMRAELIGIALTLDADHAVYVPIGHRGGDGGSGLFGDGLAPDQIPAATALEVLRPLLEDASVAKIGHDIKTERLVLARHGIALAPVDDVMLMSYVLDAGLGSHSLASLAEKWLGHAALATSALTGTGKTAISFDRVAIDQATAYAAERAALALRLEAVLRPRLVAARMLTVYETLERPLVAVLARMEARGIAIDRQVLARLSGDFAQTAARLEDDIRTLAGEDFNPGSPKQLGDILFGKMGLPGGKKTKTGAWSTTASILEDLAEEGHELPRRIIDWRQVAKLKSNYTDALPDYVNPTTGRVHTSYALAATTTGRLSSSEPNLQNIPVRTEDGRKIRRAFVATKGHKLVSADYSQIELRLLAEIADIPELRKAFRNGDDIHTLTASEMFDVPVAKMTPEVRRRAKAINFGIIYGISAFGLANQLGIPREDAAAYIKKYFERFPGIRTYMDETRDFARANGYVTTLFGRKCHYPDIKASNASVRAFNERAAINARLQGSAADIIRRAMIRMDDALARDNLAAQMLLQVHDELIFEVPDGEVAATLPVVKKVMEDAPFPAVTLSVPLQVDARAADNWDAAH